MTTALDALRQAAEWFREYEASHRAKADRNRDRAIACEQALIAASEPVLDAEVAAQITKLRSDPKGFWGVERQKAADMLERLATKNARLIAAQSADEGVESICAYCNGNGWFYSDPDLGPCGCEFGQVRRQLDALTKGVAAVRKTASNLMIQPLTPEGHGASVLAEFIVKSIDQHLAPAATDGGHPMEDLGDGRWVDAEPPTDCVERGKREHPNAPYPRSCKVCGIRKCPFYRASAAQDGEVDRG